jgi:hypothetical protein
MPSEDQDGRPTSPLKFVIRTAAAPFEPVIQTSGLPDRLLTNASRPSGAKPGIESSTGDAIRFTGLPPATGTE